jgi:GNAT superfamily N-acetyltransferase
MQNLKHRKATIDDLKTIVHLLAEDELGQARENLSQEVDNHYVDAFHLIDNDPNQYLMLVIDNNEIIGTCHLTIMPSLTFIGTTRMQIEAVRVAKEHRGQRMGEWMMNAAFEYGKSKGAKTIQLTTNIKRPRAKQFYERLGFVGSHVGMKLYIKD